MDIPNEQAFFEYPHFVLLVLKKSILFIATADIDHIWEKLVKKFDVKWLLHVSFMYVVYYGGTDKVKGLSDCYRG